MPDTLNLGGSSKSATRSQIDAESSDTIVAGSLTITPLKRQLAIRRSSMGFEVVHRFGGEWVGVSYPARVRHSLRAACADLEAHREKDADRKFDFRANGGEP